MHSETMKKLRRRDKRYKRNERKRKKLIERYHSWKVQFAYATYYKDANL